MKIKCFSLVIDTCMNFLQYFNSMSYTFFFCYSQCLHMLRNFVRRSTKAGSLKVPWTIMSGINRRFPKKKQQARVRHQHMQLPRITKRHFPEKIPDGKRKKCVVCSTSHERFRKSRIQWWCPNCKVGLCVEGCFRTYHTRHHYEE